MGRPLDFAVQFETQEAAQDFKRLFEAFIADSKRAGDAANAALGGTVKKTVELRLEKTGDGDKQLALATKEARTELDKYTRAYQKQLKIQPGSATSLRQQLNKAKADRDEISKFGREIESLTRKGAIIGLKLSPEWAAADVKVRRLQSQLRELELAGKTGFQGVGAYFDLTKLNAIGRGISDLVSAFQSLGIITSALLQPIKSVTGALADLQSFGLAFEAIGQGSSGAALALNQANKIALGLGVNIQTVREGFKQLSPVVLNSGGDIRDVSEIVKSLSSRFAAFGLNADKSRRVLNGVIQSFAKGKLQAEELTQQISEADPAFKTDFANALFKSANALSLVGGKTGELGKELQELATQGRKPVEALEELVKNGKITSDVLIQILPQLSKAELLFGKLGPNASSAVDALSKGEVIISQVEASLANLNQLNLEKLAKIAEPLVINFLKAQAVITDFVATALDVPNVLGAGTSVVKDLVSTIGSFGNAFINVLELILAIGQVLLNLAGFVTPFIDAIAKIPGLIELSSIALLGKFLPALKRTGKEFTTIFFGVDTFWGRLGDAFKGSARPELDKTRKDLTQIRKELLKPYETAITESSIPSIEESKKRAEEEKKLSKQREASESNARDQRVTEEDIANRAILRNTRTTLDQIDAEYAKRAATRNKLLRRQAANGGRLTEEDQFRLDSATKSLRKIQVERRRFLRNEQKTETDPTIQETKSKALKTRRDEAIASQEAERALAKEASDRLAKERTENSLKLKTLRSIVNERQREVEVLQRQIGIEERQWQRTRQLAQSLNVRPSRLASTRKQELMGFTKKDLLEEAKKQGITNRRNRDYIPNLARMGKDLMVEALIDIDFKIAGEPQKRLTVLTDQLNDAKAKLAKSIADIETTAAKETDLSGLFARATGPNADLTDQLRATGIALNNTRIIYRGLGVEITDTEKRISSLQGKLKSLESTGTKGAVSTRSAAQLREMMSLREEIKTLQLELTNLQDRQRKVGASADDLQSAYKALEEQGAKTNRFTSGLSKSLEVIGVGFKGLGSAVVKGAKGFVSAIGGLLASLGPIEIALIAAGIATKAYNDANESTATIIKESADNVKVLDEALLKLKGTINTTSNKELSGFELLWRQFGNAVTYVSGLLYKSLNPVFVQVGTQAEKTKSVVGGLFQAFLAGAGAGATAGAALSLFSAGLSAPGAAAAGAAIGGLTSVILALTTASDGGREKIKELNNNLYAFGKGAAEQVGKANQLASAIEDLIRQKEALKKDKKDTTEVDVKIGSNFSILSTAVTNLKDKLDNLRLQAKATRVELNNLDPDVIKFAKSSVETDKLGKKISELKTKISSLVMQQYGPDNKNGPDPAVMREITRLENQAKDLEAQKAALEKTKAELENRYGILNGKAVKIGQITPKAVINQYNNLIDAERRINNQLEQTDKQLAPIEARAKAIADATGRIYDPARQAFSSLIQLNKIVDDLQEGAKTYDLTINKGRKGYDDDINKANRLKDIIEFLSKTKWQIQIEAADIQQKITEAQLELNLRPGAVRDTLKLVSQIGTNLDTAGKNFLEKVQGAKDLVAQNPKFAQEAGEYIKQAAAEYLTATRDGAAKIVEAGRELTKTLQEARSGLSNLVLQKPEFFSAAEFEQAAARIREDFATELQKVRQIPGNEEFTPKLDYSSQVALLKSMQEFVETRRDAARLVDVMQQAAESLEITATALARLAKIEPKNLGKAAKEYASITGTDPKKLKESEKEFADYADEILGTYKQLGSSLVNKAGETVSRIGRVYGTIKGPGGELVLYYDRLKGANQQVAKSEFERMKAAEKANTRSVSGVQRIGEVQGEIIANGSKQILYYDNLTKATETVTQAEFKRLQASDAAKKGADGAAAAAGTSVGAITQKIVNGTIVLENYGTAASKVGESIRNSFSNAIQPLEAYTKAVENTTKAKAAEINIQAIRNGAAGLANLSGSESSDRQKVILASTQALKDAQLQLNQATKDYEWAVAQGYDTTALETYKAAIQTAKLAISGITDSQPVLKEYNKQWDDGANKIGDYSEQIRQIPSPQPPPEPADTEKWGYASENIAKQTEESAKSADLFATGMNSAADAAQRINEAIASIPEKIKLNGVINISSQPAGRWAGGPVSAGTSYRVNELGQEGFLSNSGNLSAIMKPRNATWRPTSSGTVIPANIWSKLKGARNGVTSASIGVSNTSRSQEAKLMVGLLNRYLSAQSTASNQGSLDMKRIQSHQAIQIAKLAKAVDRLATKDWNVDVKVRNTGNAAYLDTLTRSI